MEQIIGFKHWLWERYGMAHM